MQPVDEKVEEYIAKKAEEVYRAIRVMRKEAPAHMNAAARANLAAREQELKDRWWEDNKHLFRREKR